MVDKGYLKNCPHCKCRHVQPWKAARDYRSYCGTCYYLLGLNK